MQSPGTARAEPRAARESTTQGPASGAPGERTRIVRDLAIAILFVFITLSAIEAAMRLAGVRYSVSFFTRDAERGYAFRPNATGWWMGDGRVYMHINREGYHDREHTLAKPPGVIRIAVLGSSFVAAPDVPLKTNFVSLLQNDLNTDFGKPRVETLNFGVNAYSPPQSFVTLDKDVWRYHPDIVIFAVTPVDITDTCREIAFNTNFLFRPYYEVDSSGKVVPDQLTRQIPPPNPAQVAADDRLNELVSRFELTLALHFALQNRGKAGPREDGAGVLHLPKGANPHDPFRKINDFPEVLPSLPPPHDGPVEQCWQVFEAMMPELKRDAGQHGAEVWIVPIGFPTQENPNPSVREQFVKRTGIPDLFFWDKRAVAIAQANGLHSIDLPPLFAAYATEHHVYLHGFPSTKPGVGHWNERGHKLAAEVIAANLWRSSRFFGQSQ